MPDVHNPETRSRNMASIRGRNTKPELLVRKGLHVKGFRYLVNDKRLPGRPDIVLPKYNAVVFVNGCFWHGHGCAAFRWPRTREEFWREKIEANVARDQRNYLALSKAGWRHAIVWECTLKGPHRSSPEAVTETLSAWLTSGSEILQLSNPDNQPERN